MKPKKCEQCNVKFLPKYRVTAAYWKRRRFCSSECRAAGQVGKTRPFKGRHYLSLEQKFWPKVNKQKNDCWPWIGATTRQGYGYLGGSCGDQNMLAHRLSYELHFGKSPGNLCVCHHCDNKLCVNPAHLFLGTRADNNADKIAKGRSADVHGEKNPRAKLTTKKIPMIFQLRQKGLSQQAIADRVGVSQVQISKILRGKAWI